MTVFPDRSRELWDDSDSGRTDGLADAAFASKLVEWLVADRLASGGETYLVGLSNGASVVELLARQGVVRTTGIVLVAGTVREVSRRGILRPGQSSKVLCLAGTADPLVLFAGGRGRGPLASTARRRVRHLLVDARGRESVGEEVIASDWAAANGCGPVPQVQPLTQTRGVLPVDRMSWRGPGCPPVVLYRIRGGGYGWGVDRSTCATAARASADPATGP